MNEVRTTHNWRAVKIGIWFVVDEAGNPICEGVTEEVARLIAAAPELMASLSGLCAPDVSYHGGEIRIPMETHGVAVAAMIKARKAIASAESSS